MRCAVGVALGWMAMTVTGCGADTLGPEGSGADDGGAATSAQALTASGEARACAAWQSARDRYAQTPAWSAGAASCDLGALPAATREASLAWVNYFRGLVGLAAVAEDPNDRSAAQGCAVLLERNGRLSHTPPATWACATLAARDAAGRSNLSGNVGYAMNAWQSVRGWIDEGRDLSGTLGHRRWLFSPELRTVAYGQTGSFACMTLGLGAPDADAPRAVAWPPGGWVPTAVMGTIWSYSAAGVTGPGTEVEVLRDGARVPVTVTERAAGRGEDTVSWDMPAAVGGSVYRVTVRVRGRADATYEVRPTACGRR